MSKPVYRAFMLVIVLSISNQSCVAEDQVDMKLSRCGESENFFNLSFVSLDKKRIGLFTLLPEDETAKISVYGNVGVVEWKYISHLTLSKSEEFVVEFTDPIPFQSGRILSSLTYGDINGDCWEKLKGFVQGKLSLREL